MLLYLQRKRAGISFKLLVFFLVALFLGSSILIYFDRTPKTYASFLPSPTQLIELSPKFIPVNLRGVTVHSQDPFTFDFVIDAGRTGMPDDELRSESRKLIKYFLASLTIPADDLWVNLSPYEKERIAPDELGVTDMGKDMLAQDYILKQLLASVTYPESALGKEFWEKVYARVYSVYGTTNVPVNTFNRIWIVPDKASIVEKGESFFVAQSSLKVMLEQDYFSMKNNLNNQKLGTQKVSEEKVKDINDISSSVMREIVLPAIEKEVNEGKNFASLRQVYNALILATWFKKRLKEHIITQVYSDKKKIKGIDTQTKDIKEKIYKQYLEAYTRGVYNYIKTDFDKGAQQNISRRYYSGGLDMAAVVQGTVLAAPGIQPEPMVDGSVQTARLTPEFAGSTAGASGVHAGMGGAGTTDGVSGAGDSGGFRLPEQETLREPVRERTWRVLSALSVSRGASDGAIGRHPARDAGPLGSEAIALEEDGERIMQEVVETMSEDDIVAMIRRTNPGVDFRAEDLSRQVYSEFYSDEGIHKTVYRVVFLLEGGRSADLIMIMKSPKDGSELTDEEIEYQRRLEAAGVRVPHFGAKLNLRDGRRIYFEEFIPGVSAGLLYDEGRLTPALRNQIVRIIFNAYFSTGMAPNDIHRMNFIISDKDGLPVLIDVGNMGQRAHRPIDFFFNVLLFYGYFDIDDEVSQHLEWSMGNNFAFYDTILDVYTHRPGDQAGIPESVLQARRAEGIQLLEEVWNQWDIMLRYYPPYERGMPEHRNSINLYNELFEYFSRLPENSSPENMHAQGPAGAGLSAPAGTGQPDTGRIAWHVSAGAAAGSGVSFDAGAVQGQRATRVVANMVESLQQVLAEKPEREITAMVRDLLPADEAASLDLDGQVGVRLYSDEGRNKDVFLISFHSKSGKDHQVIVALKSQKKGALVRAVDEMQLLLDHKGKPGILKVGGHFKTVDGLDAYFVEFVPGKTLDQLEYDDASETARLGHARLATEALLDAYDALDGMLTTDPHRGNIIVSGNKPRLIDYDWTVKQTSGEVFLRIAYHHYQLQTNFDIINSIYLQLVARYGEQKAREFLTSVEAEIGAYLHADDPDYVQVRQHWYAGNTPDVATYERSELIFPIVGRIDLVTVQYALKDYLSRFIHSPPAQIPADAELSAHLKGRFSPSAYFHDRNEPTATDISHTGIADPEALRALENHLASNPEDFFETAIPADVASLIVEGELIDPDVVRQVQVFIVDDDVLNNKELGTLGLDGDAYSTRNRIFIRRSAALDRTLFRRDHRITRFAQVLIHELVARHLALRQQVAAGEGDVHHWAARNIEQQIEMMALVNHRNSLQAQPFGVKDDPETLVLQVRERTDRISNEWTSLTTEEANLLLDEAETLLGRLGNPETIPIPSAGATAIQWNARAFIEGRRQVIEKELKLKQIAASRGRPFLPAGSWNAPNLEGTPAQWGLYGHVTAYENLYAIVFGNNGIISGSRQNPIFVNIGGDGQAARSRLLLKAGIVPVVLDKQQLLAADPPIALSGNIGEATFERDVPIRFATVNSKAFMWQALLTEIEERGEALDEARKSRIASAFGFQDYSSLEQALTQPARMLAQQFPAVVSEGQETLNREIERLKQVHSQELASIEAQMAEDRVAGRTAPTEDRAMSGRRSRQGIDWRGEVDGNATKEESETKGGTVKLEDVQAHADASSDQDSRTDSSGGTAKLSDISARPEPVAGQTEAQVKQETRPQAVADKLKEAQRKEVDSKAQDPIWSTLNRFSSYWNLRGRSPFAENIPLRPTPTRRQAMVQGFKIHVDIRHSDPNAISQMLERILRILNKQQVSSKVIKSVPLAKSVLGSFQAGKTITIYPYYVDDTGEVVFISSGEWHRLVSEIDDALMQWKTGSPTFRDRQGERVIGDSGRIGYRFGGLTSDVIFDESSMAKTGPLSPAEFIFDIRQDSSHHVEQDHTKWRSDIPPPGSGVVRQAPAQLPLEQAFQDYKKPPRAYGAASEFFSNLFPGKKTQVRALINLERPSIFMMVQDFIMRLFGVRTITYTHVRAEQSQRRLMFTATIGGKPWMFKVMEYGGLSDPALGKVDNAAQIDWVKELIITEIARQQGFLDNVAANNPVDFLRATGMPDVASQLQRAALAKDYDAISEVMRRYFMFGSDPVVVMRQVPGASAWKEPAKMTQAQYRDAMKQLRTLVDTLHTHGVMHRDIKPANILLERAGLFGVRERVVLIDFENAALVSDGKIQSAPLEMETPYYAFPFQNRNFFTLLDERTQERWFRFHDEFALSVMDYEQRSGLRVAEMFGRRDWMYLRQEFYLFLPGRTTLQDLMNDPSLTIKTYFDPSLQKTIQSSASKDDQDNNRLAQPVQDRPSSSPMDNAAGEKIGVSPQEGIPGGIDLSSPSRSEPQLDKGGIDLNPKNLNIEVKGDDMHRSEAIVSFDRQHFEGFTFTILKIEAIDDGSKIFGFTPAQEEEATLAKR